MCKYSKEQATIFKIGYFFKKLAEDSGFELTLKRQMKKVLHGRMNSKNQNNDDLLEDNEKTQFDSE